MPGLGLLGAASGRERSRRGDSDAPGHCRARRHLHRSGRRPWSRRRHDRRPARRPLVPAGSRAPSWEIVRQHLNCLVGAARRAPLTVDGTFGGQAPPQHLPGDFAAVPWATVYRARAGRNHDRTRRTGSRPHARTFPALPPVPVASFGPRAGPFRAISRAFRWPVAPSSQRKGQFPAGPPGR